MNIADALTRMRAWAPRVLFTGAAQAAVQACGFVAGLMVIRLLPPDQYAYYTLALTALGMLTVLSDGGVSNAFMALGGPRWNDPKVLGETYYEAIRQRRALSTMALVLALPLLLFTLLDHNMHPASAAVLGVALVPLFLATVIGQLRETVLKLHQHIAAMQTVQLSGGTLRILAVAVGLFFVPEAWVAVFAAAFVQALVNIPLGRRIAPLVHKPEVMAPAWQDAYRRYLKRSLPGAIYFALAGQANVLIISVLGNTQAVAEVGVAGRLGAVCSIVTAVIGMVVVPRFARAALQPLQQLRAICTLVLVILILGAALSGGLWSFPQAVPWLVGANYSGLQLVVFWSIWSSILGIAGGAVYHLAAARGHVMGPSLTVATAMSSFALSFLLIGASTPLQVFKMNALSATGVLVVSLIYCVYILSRSPLDKQAH